MKQIILFLFLLSPILLTAQTALGGAPDSESKEDTIKPPISAYKIISVANDTTFVDTTLTIEKDYKFKVEN